jgi:hypothetical protein
MKTELHYGMPCLFGCWGLLGALAGAPILLDVEAQPPRPDLRKQMRVFSFSC